MEILSITEEGLGHTSHLIGLGDGTALVTDPTRFPDRQRRLAAERGWRIAWAADTHSHADYISGSPALAADGAVFVAPAQARLEHAHRGVEAGEDLEIADGVVLRAIATPGHTPDHLAYLLLEHGHPVGLFSGGSLMVGTVGRTDLLGDEHARAARRRAVPGPPTRDPHPPRRPRRLSHPRRRLLLLSAIRLPTVDNHRRGADHQPATADHR